MGLIHLDAGVIIGLLDASDAHHCDARTVLDNTLRDGESVAMAASALAECLVGPARQSDDAVDTVRNLVGRVPISVVSVDVEVATTAARLRAAHRGLRLPDALVIATAIEAHAERLVTTDRKWPTAKALRFDGTIEHL